MKQNKIFYFLIIISITFSCNPSDEIPFEILPKHIKKFSVTFIDSLANGNIDYCFNQLEDSIKTYENKKLMRKVHEYIKNKELVDFSLVGYESSVLLNDSEKKDTYKLRFEYVYNDVWIYYKINIKETNSRMLLQGFYLMPTDKSLKELNRFTLKGKRLIHFVFLAVMALIPIFIVFSVYKCITLPLKHKALWVIFMIISFIAIRINWTSGDIGIQLINVSVFGAGYYSRSGIVEPWMLKFTLPIGTIIFWIFKNRLIQMNYNKEIIKNEP